MDRFTLYFIIENSIHRPSGLLKAVGLYASDLGDEFMFPFGISENGLL
jgi:hypothetical protein